MRSMMMFLSLLFVLCGIAIYGQHPGFADDQKVDADGIAVVELFTSEGCSSCPPADRLLSEIAQKAREKNQNIYPLSFHVDYWNYIGWTDPYSDASFSDRQRQYAQAFKTSRIYTPQMIVNGQKEFVGSSSSQAHSAISSALKMAASAKINLKASDLEDGVINVNYKVEGLPAGHVVNLALVERHLEQQVQRGENSGRTLKHDNVVRAFNTAKSAEGAVHLQASSEVRLENCAVIGYVQDGTTMRIIGASAVDL